MNDISNKISDIRGHIQTSMNWANSKLNMIDPSSHGSTANEIEEVITALEMALDHAKRLDRINNQR